MFGCMLSLPTKQKKPDNIHDSNSSTNSSPIYDLYSHKGISKRKHTKLFSLNQKSFVLSFYPRKKFKADPALNQSICSLFKECNSFISELEPSW